MKFLQSVSAKNALLGWKQIQSGELLGYYGDLSVINTLLTDTLQGDGYIDHRRSIQTSEFTDNLNNKWTICIDVSSIHKTLIRISVVTENDWLEITCIGNYTNYEISTRSGNKRK